MIENNCLSHIQTCTHLVSPGCGPTHFNFRGVSSFHFSFQLTLYVFGLTMKCKEPVLSYFEATLHTVVCKHSTSRQHLSPPLEPSGSLKTLSNVHRMPEEVGDEGGKQGFNLALWLST